MTKRLTRAQAIAAKCKDCTYDNLEPGTWVQQAERCNGTRCALYPYRPMSRGKARPAPESQDTDIAQRCTHSAEHDSP